MSHSPDMRGTMQLYERFPFLHDLPLLDKVAHVGSYAVLGALLSLATERPLVAFLIAAAYGVSDEVHQIWIDGRTASIYDWFADLIGAGIACALAGLFLPRP
jgi:VanZ family protein